MHKAIATIVTIAMISGGVLSFAPIAKADDGRIAAGVASGILGCVLLGGAIAEGWTRLRCSSAASLLPASLPR